MLVKWCICSCTEIWDSSLKTSITWESLRISAWELWKSYSRHTTKHIIIPTRESSSGTCVGAYSITWDQRKKHQKSVWHRAALSASRRLFISSFNKINYHVLIEQLLLTAPPLYCVPWWDVRNIKSNSGWKTETPRCPFFIMYNL